MSQELNAVSNPGGDSQHIIKAFSLLEENQVFPFYLCHVFLSKVSKYYKLKGDLNQAKN